MSDPEERPEPVAQKISAWVERPKVLLIARWVLGMILVAAGVTKAVQLDGFHRFLVGNAFIPASLLSVVTILIPTIELLLGVMFISGFLMRIAAPASLALLLLFTFYLVAGETLSQTSCGCFGSLSQNTPFWLELTRNVFLLSLSAAVLLGLNPPQKKWRSLRVLTWPFIAVGIVVAFSLGRISAPASSDSGQQVLSQQGIDFQTEVADSLIENGERRFIQASFEILFSLNDSETKNLDEIFQSPRSAAVNTHGDFYIVDQAGTVKVFDKFGRYISSLGRRGEGPGELKDPVDIAISPEGYIYVANHGNLRVEVFSPDHRFIRSILCPGFPYRLATGPGNVLYVRPAVLDTATVRMYDSEGRYVLSFGPKYSVKDFFGFVSYGHRNNFNDLRIASDQAGNVYHCNATLYEIHKFSSSRKPILRFSIDDPQKKEAIANTIEVTRKEPHKQGYMQFIVDKMVTDGHDRLWVHARGSNLDGFQTDGRYLFSMDLRRAFPKGAIGASLLTYNAITGSFLFVIYPDQRIVCLKVLQEL